MKTAIVLGSNSDIAKGLIPILEDDGWTVYGWQRGENAPVIDDWELLICALGSVAPVGLWHDVDLNDWMSCFGSNLFIPFGLLQDVWGHHGKNASVCFLAGSNPNMIMPGYSAYNVSKMALLKVVEQMDFETPDAKFFALGPGTILTKIHNATFDANWYNPKLASELTSLRASGETLNNKRDMKIRQVYECLKWCIAQPKEVIGGRNICVSDPYDETLAKTLLKDPNLFKIRRYEG